MKRDPSPLRPTRKVAQPNYPKLGRRNFLALLSGAVVFPALLKGCGAAPNSPQVYSRTLPSSGEASAALADGIIHYTIGINFDSYEFSLFLQDNEEAALNAISDRLTPFSVDQLINCGTCKTEAESDIQASLENLFTQANSGVAGILSLTLTIHSSAPN